MPRNRSLLIDASQSKVFCNVVNVSSANATSLIAGQVLKSIVIPQGSATSVVAVAQNVGAGFKPAANSQIVSITATVVTAPTTRAITILVKKGTTYSTSVTMATLTIAATTKTTTSNTTINLTAPSDMLFYDVTQVGTPQTGIGLSVTYNYYTGY